MRTEDEVIKQLKDRCELHIKMKESGDEGCEMPRVQGGK